MTRSGPRAELAQLARAIDAAAADGVAIPQLSSLVEFSEADAYEIQRQSVDLRLSRGERLVGIKMGFTSRAKMIQMGVDDLIWGRLTSSMHKLDGGSLSLDGFVHPRIEPEVAFLMKRPLSGIVSPAQAMAAVEAVAPAMEIIDSRYENFRFSLADVVADNCSSSGFVVGPWVSPDVDLSNRGMIVEFDGRPVQVGSTAAILGHPARSLAEAARVVADHGMQLEAGWIVLAGAATAATHLRPGVHVRLVAEALGQVEISVGG